ncbi:hypothetical protein P3102_34245 [Amycolatopsis sp. QT-25]|uniref:hypothetical protein n=1 Tax=Amycolatopsis sp. QT-25 TaxID=3034022 RepID=UPI0023ECF88C|nr:hypothetical protein [Amycolatopsis sp. QT-25]WET79038.1 hypothetical protein P3102_34245 [Amycolatopsis sp. QT-25]
MSGILLLTARQEVTVQALVNPERQTLEQRSLWTPDPSLELAASRSPTDAERAAAERLDQAARPKVDEVDWYTSQFDDPAYRRLIIDGTYGWRTVPLSALQTASPHIVDHACGAPSTSEILSSSCLAGARPAARVTSGNSDDSASEGRQWVPPRGRTGGSIHIAKSQAESTRNRHACENGDETEPNGAEGNVNPTRITRHTSRSNDMLILSRQGGSNP